MCHFQKTAMTNLKPYLTAKNIALLVLAVSVIVLIAVLFSRSRPVTTNDTAQRLLRLEMDSLKAENKRLLNAGRLLYEAYETRRKVDSVLLDNAIKNKNEAVEKIHGFNSDSLSRYFENL